MFRHAVAHRQHRWESYFQGLIESYGIPKMFRSRTSRRNASSRAVIVPRHIYDGDKYFGGDEDNACGAKYVTVRLV